ncbi:flagellar type III secretion system pore protein FliP [Paeniclostridium sordellii]|uniref:flagellar type III secretion system pore protein FliP n=1 Tax=Paraclostridium sordellii TaxID=1505 RepID=UPI0005DD687A|nr:flagellar type III secretion system pore protein FliP [Paeniclostridium sordellii]MDU5020113.1 flagellar type III secretion system pore protein FliP [Clostridiales bacterium]AUN15168.1 flagellar biosynthetic protein FliP [Paeniclostridium sordellii]MVO74744.1 flagellar type III secretion system pore protein FliP [Paeniclostridium sordellii]CEO14001.1 flagellar biosynthesis protein FliP [[Clostridium] sordellii] [Paeniclostridium sordellii]CEQ17359.1 flagellar biosynthesis protein FliP [[Clo
MQTLSDLTPYIGDYTPLMKLFLVLTALMFLGTIVFMMTSFVRIIITFSFIKSALGAQQSIPNQVLVGLAICLTMFVMAPTVKQINDQALKPYMNNEIKFEQAIEKAEVPVRKFLLKQTRQEDIKLFVDNSDVNKKKITRNNIPLYILVPAFAISELKTAFQIGFLIYLPFLLIDLVVSSVLMSMGMFMLPPVMISLPFKLLLFIMVDGWNLLIKSLLLSFQ